MSTRRDAALRRAIGKTGRGRAFGIRFQVHGMLSSKYPVIRCRKAYTGGVRMIQFAAPVHEPTLFR